MKQLHRRKIILSHLTFYHPMHDTTEVARHHQTVMLRGSIEEHHRLPQPQQSSRRPSVVLSAIPQTPPSEAQCRQGCVNSPRLDRRSATNSLSHQLKKSGMSCSPCLLTLSHPQGCPSFSQSGDCSTASCLSFRSPPGGEALLFSHRAPAATCIHHGHQTVTGTHATVRKYYTFMAFRPVLSLDTFLPANTHITIYHCSIPVSSHPCSSSSPVPSSQA